MDHTYPVDQQIRGLRADDAELNAVRGELLKLLDVAGVGLDLALMVGRSVVERIVNAVLAVEGFEVRRDLLDNIETLGSSDDKPTRRRGGRPPCLPENVYSPLHELRISGNLVVHPYLPGSTLPRNVSLGPRDLDLALRQLLRAVEWFFEHYERGPRLETIFDAVPAEPALAVGEQQSHLHGFVGREEELAEARAWIDSREGGYLLWLGPPGQGKSALMAELIRRESASERGGCLWHMIKSQGDPLRFVPALLGQAARLAHVALAPDAYHGDLRDLRTALHDALRSLVERTGRAVLLIDALDELVAGDEQRAYDPRIEFLPETLPPGVRAVLTCRPDIPLINALRARLRGLTERDVPPLSATDFRQLLEAQLDEATRQAVATQLGVEALFERMGGNPLLLRAAVERLSDLARQARERQQPLRLSWDDLATTQEAVFRQQYDRIGERVGTRWTTTEGRHKARMLELLCVAREGLGHEELAGLLAADGKALSRQDCRDRVDEMSQYLLDVGGRRYKPWHQGFTDHLRREVLGEEGIRELEEVYCRWLAGGRGGRYGLRHQVGHLLAAGRANEAAALLTDLPQLEARAEAGLVFELAGDFTATVAALPEGVERRRLALLEEGLRQDIHFIQRHPTTLFQCLWNNCWWYDCPDAVRHYVEGRSPGHDAGVELYRLLEQWRARKVGAVWLRSLRPPPLHLGTMQRIFRGHEGGVRSVSWSPDGRRLASAGDKTVRVWDAASGTQLLRLQGHERSVVSVSWSLDGRRLASASADETVRVWDAASGTELNRLQGHDGTVVSVSWSPDGRRLASASEYQTVRVWDVASGTQLLHLRLRNHVVTSVNWSPDGRRLAIASSDKMVRVWDVTSGTELLCLRGHEGWVESVSWSPDGRRLASASADQTVRVWDAASGAELLCLQGHGGWVESVSWSPDGRRLASASCDRTVRVWDAASGTQLLRLQGHEREVQSVSWSPDGRRLASASHDQTVRVWDAASSTELNRLQGHEREVQSVSWSPDGRRLASCCHDYTVRVWDAVSGTELLLLRLQDHRLGVQIVRWSPDGCRLASASGDQTVRVWDAASGTELLCLRGHEGGVQSVSWSPDGRRLVTTAAACDHAGRRLASASSDKTVRVWDAASGECLDVLARGSDPFASEAGDTTSRWRAVLASLETAVQTVSSKQAVAWFPQGLRKLAAHPAGRTWAGASSNHVYLFTLEGEP